MAIKNEAKAKLINPLSYVGWGRLQVDDGTTEGYQLKENITFTGDSFGQVTLDENLYIYNNDNQGTLENIGFYENDNGMLGALLFEFNLLADNLAISPYQIYGVTQCIVYIE